jgi:DNA-3-methyladenine glycosylase I
LSLKRCAWAQTPAMIEYHDREWGVPVHDDRRLFEFLVLEGAQAGLSWETILRKRAGYRAAFAEFDPAKVARFGERRVATLMRDAAIVRNEAKIRAAIGNARIVLALQDECGSLDAYFWRFVDGKPIVTARRRAAAAAQTPLSKEISRDLLRRGMRFVGPTIVYAFMQAVGMVNDHRADCFRYADLKAGRRLVARARRTNAR